MLSNQTLVAALTGYLSGGVMYSYLIPRLICGRDVRSAASDRNPGASNAGLTCGRGIGILCGALDVLKAFLPVFIACWLDIVDGWALVPVAVAPVLGHAFPPMLHFRGGKAITAAYGALLGLLPWHPLGLVLAGAMALCVVLIKNHAAAVSTASLLFMICATLLFRGNAPIRMVAYLMSSVLIYKHWDESRTYMLKRADKAAHRKAA